jgi:hypothetical protein
VRPDTTPRACGSNTGVRSPAKYGSISKPSLPGGTAPASAINSSNGAPPVIDCNHSMSVPAVDVPAASAKLPQSTPAVVHNVGSGRYSSMIWTRNIVDPYISIRSPGCRTPAENASEYASTVPATTGVPTATPVASAASGRTVPTTSLGQTNLGSGRCQHTRKAHARFQSKSRVA